MVIRLDGNLKKLELEKNKFIRELSREQFDNVITNKYKKAFMEYFDGNINDFQLVDKINSNFELVNIYANNDVAKIDSNQYLYCAIVDVALNYYNKANGFESCCDKVNLFASYFQLIASSESKLSYLEDLIYDIFFINANLDCKQFLDRKLLLVSDAANSLNKILIEISKYDDLISEIENENNMSFVDDPYMDNTIKEVYIICKNLSKNINSQFQDLQNECVDISNGVSLDIMKGKIKLN